MDPTPTRSQKIEIAILFGALAPIAAFFLNKPLSADIPYTLEPTKTHQVVPYLSETYKTIDTVLFWIFVVAMIILCWGIAFSLASDTTYSWNLAVFLIICLVVGCLIALTRIILFYTMIKVDDDSTSSPMTFSPTSSTLTQDIAEVRSGMTTWGWVVFAMMFIYTFVYSILIWINKKDK
jgi:hypothetical protein